MVNQRIGVLVSLIFALTLSACSMLGGGEELPADTGQPAAPPTLKQQPTSPPAPQQQVQQPEQAPPTAPPVPTASWKRGPEPDKAPEFVRAFGKSGTALGQLSGPTSVAVDADGNFYVGDNKGLHKFDPDGKYLLSYGPDGYAGYTSAVSVGPDGTIYRSAPEEDVVVMYTPDGEKIGTLGESGSGKGQFDEPFGLTFDSQGNLYVVDRRNFRVQKFDPDGKFLMSFGSRGDKNGEFINPRDVALDAQGNIYVTDQATYLIQKFNPEGEFLLRLGQAHGDENLWLMRGIAIDDSGYIYVVDGLHARIQVFDTTGNYLLEFGLPGEESGNFKDPDGVFIRDDKLYVADKGNNRIQEFALQR